jgi:pilus assembly protein Flp/PilA
MRGSRCACVSASGLAFPQGGTSTRNGTSSRAIDQEQATRALNNDKRTVTVQLLHRFMKDESAATAIEYGLIAAGISLAIIAVVNGLGAKLNTKFSAINTSLK